MVWQGVSIGLTINLKANKNKETLINKSEFSEGLHKIGLIVRAYFPSMSLPLLNSSTRKEVNFMFQKWLRIRLAEVTRSKLNSGKGK